ncbi:hypothetical protein [Prochlorococcus marinus]|uniref:hypothetical protein n=1 Tax=Prochlorococcus TaxID=1218 RepID=UPI0007B36D2E|nr:hypothetical protein [Prochlorococcus marinus]
MTKKQRQCGGFGTCVGTDSRGFIATYLSPKHRLSKWFQAVSGGLAVIVNTTEFNHSPDHPGDHVVVIPASESEKLQERQNAERVACLEARNADYLEVLNSSRSRLLNCSLLFSQQRRIKNWRQLRSDR